MLSLNRQGQTSSAIAIATILIFATAGQYAFADNVQNDVAANPGSNSIIVGGSTTVGYRINANNGDGQTGCNAADSTPATVTINVPAGVVRSPTSLTFTACGATQSVIFSSSTAGDYPITVSVSDSGVGTYNTSPATFTLHVLAPSNTAPTLNLPSNISAEATGASGAPVSYSATATDAEDNPDPTPSCTPVSGSTFPIGQTTVNCTVVDSGGLSASGSFTVTVQDTTQPQVTVPADMILEATSAAGATATFVSSATDAVDGVLIPSCSPSSGSSFPLGETVVTCSATDAHENTSTKSFKVTVQDTTSPVVTVPTSQTVEATGPSGTIVTYSGQSATDSVDGILAVSCLPLSGSTFSLGSTSVNCTATDSHGNTGSNSFSVIVQDTSAPVVAVPADQTVEASGPSGAVVSFSSPSASDVVDGSIQASCTYSSGATFPIGSTVVSCTATDSHGNTGTNSFTINVVDTTAPTIDISDGIGTPVSELALPGHIVVEATGPDGTQATFIVHGNDAVDGATSVSCSYASGTTFPLGSTTVSCTSTDSHNNTATATFVIDVVDTTPPAITVPSNITEEATGPAGANVSFSASASDIVDGTVAVVCTPSSGSTFPLTTTLVTCDATDAHHNQASATFNVTVRDTTAPIVTVPNGLSFEATGPSGASVTFSTSSFDIVDLAADAVVCDQVSGATLPLGTTNVSCSATDAHGNTGSATFAVTVQDTTAPAITVPSDLSSEATSSSGAVVTYSGQAANDIVDGSIPVICAPSSGSTFPLGTSVVSCSATDAHGNTGTSSFNVTVQDTTAPVVSVPSNMIAEATSSSGAVVTYNGQSASDIVDGSVPVNCSPSTGSTFSIGSTTLTCSATDAHHNTGSAAFTITVRDTTAPTIASHGNMALFTTSSSGTVVTYIAPTATDIVDGAVIVNCSPTSGSTFALGTTTVTCSAADAHGNTATSTFRVTVTKWSGILQPINADGSSIFKLKSTVPVKLQLFQNDGVTPDSTATVTISIVKYSGNVEGTYAEATSTSAATTGNLFRYDTTSNQYIFNWGTNGLSTGTWLLKVNVNGNDIITNTKPTNPTPTGYTIEVSLR